MDFLKCSKCGKAFEEDHRTRRRVVYKCSQCGRTFAVSKRTKKPKKSN